MASRTNLAPSWNFQLTSPRYQDTGDSQIRSDLFLWYYYSITMAYLWATVNLWKSSSVTGGYSYPHESRKSLTKRHCFLLEMMHIILTSRLSCGKCHSQCDSLFLMNLKLLKETARLLQCKICTMLFFLIFLKRFTLNYVVYKKTISSTSGPKSPLNVSTSKAQAFHLKRLSANFKRAFRLLSSQNVSNLKHSRTCFPNFRKI